MSKRELLRVCGGCGKTIYTTAESPLKGRRLDDSGTWRTTYYCCEGCLKKGQEAASGRAKAWQKAYREEHADQIRAYAHKYYAKNHDCLREKAAEYRRTHRQKLREISRRWYDENRRKTGRRTACGD